MNIFVLFCVCLFFNINTTGAQVPDSNLGLRADWMRGSWGVNWKPENFYSGVIEEVSIEPYIENLKDIRTVDYVQVHLTESNIYSPSHSAPNTLLESFWQGDTNLEGQPINLIVPRASSGSDPFLSWLKAIKAAGLKTMVYVNSYNLLARDETRISDDFPDISERWENYCDTDPAVQTFINSKSYHVDGIHSRRPYMFCYAEFVLKEYAIRYGDLIDAWGFDSADNVMEEECGDNPASEDINDQRIYEAFANAVHAGNPNAAIAFNNSVGTAAAPFTTATYFDDYCFGHPFGGAGNMVETTSLYNRNFGICEFMQDTDGHPFTIDNRTWNDNVVGRFFPKLSTTAWNAGNTPCLTDEQFVEWNHVGIINGGSILWGTPLIRTNLLNSPILTIQPYALTQLSLTDTYFKEFQLPGAPNWSRQHTILPDAKSGQTYSHTLIEGIDFWDPEGDAITSLITQNSFPNWLTITQTERGVWTLSGTPTESTDTDYEFDLSVSDASGETIRTVKLNVFEEFVPEPTIIDVQIQATENTTYTSGAVTMTGIGTVPGYDATFEIDITVTPNGDFTTYPNAVIVSGINDTNGNSNSKSWGISGDGTNDASNDRIFAGEEQFIAIINNARVGTISGSSSLTSDNITIDTFKSINIVNAHNTGDRFTFSADGSSDFQLGRLPESNTTVNLVSEAADSEIESFTIKNGSTATNNKWSVDNIIVQVSVDKSSLTLGVNSSENTFSKFRLYPNPVENKISFNVVPQSVQIYDLSGKLLKNDASGSTSLSVSDLRAGIYIVKFFTNNGEILFKKFLKN